MGIFVRCKTEPVPSRTPWREGETAIAPSRTTGKGRFVTNTKKQWKNKEKRDRVYGQKRKKMINYTSIISWVIMRISGDASEIGRIDVSVSGRSKRRPPMG